MTSATSRPPRSRTRATLAITAAILAVLVIGFFAFASFYADVLWFDQLGYLGVLTTQWGATIAMFGVGFFAMALIVWLSIFIAFRSRPVYAKLNSQLDRYQQVIEPLRRLAIYGIPIVLGIFVGVSTASRWETVLQYFNRTSFGTKDPLFGLDISFYVYELPFFRGLLGYGSAIVLVAGLAALATSYLYGGIRISGREVRVARPARIQLAITAGVYLLLQAISIWLDQYSTLTDQGELITGASYTSVNAVIPGKAILAGIAILVAILAFVTAAIGRWRLPLIGTALLIASSLVIGTIFPAVIQRFQVDPSARTLEAQYIDDNISATREAYGVADVNEQQYDAKTDTSAGALRADADTTANIRIIDPALVSDTFAQLQRVKQFYQFTPHLDVDRYAINGKTQDTVIAVRELKQESAATWYNNTLVYTHGYGVVAAYGNQRSSDGQPVFLESGIPSTGDLGKFQPRVYFGEKSPTYSIVGKGKKGPQELDYPAGGDKGDGNAYTTFNANGGPKLNSPLNRLVYAIKFQSEQIVLSDGVTDNSQILYERNPVDRVKKVAPYLTPDSDPYPAVVDGRIVWIVDGYTTTSNYPYSRVEQLSNTIVDTYTPQPGYALDDINYIRNSVKATVDAYSGKVTLYAWDANDPILKTWQKIYPSTLKPASAMSAELKSHVRYPADLFKVQRTILERYHVTNAGEFYSGNEEWVTPDDPTQAAATAKAQPPYYLTMQTPGTDKPAFSLYSTYIPRTGSGASQSVLTGYLTVNSDAGKDYGKLTLLTMPKTTTVPGPGQVQNQFTSDSDVAQQVALLERGSTKVERGNLLTLPVGGGLLYVQPVYVRATGETSYPLLRKILVSFGDKIAFEDTLDAALDSLFGGDSGADAGDGGVSPTEPGTPTTPTEPGTQDNPALKKALADYQVAFTDRQEAYASGDLVAAAEADKRMQAAVERAIAASE
ncbi:MAG TPA: UPF0182 family protein [Pseudolysinimonas sp.]|nr:UPF0182 family protein [Pseudolysinimonas sp.]